MSIAKGVTLTIESSVGATPKTINMPNTYSQMYVHVVFAVKGRSNNIPSDLKEKINQYFSNQHSNYLYQKTGRTP